MGDSELTSPLPSAAATPVTAAPPNDAAVPALQTYLKRLVPTLLEVDEAAVDAVLRSAEGNERVRLFASEQQHPVLVFVHSGVDASIDEASEVGAKQTATLEVLLSVSLKDSRSSAVAFIKRTPSLDALRPIAPQLHLLNLLAGSPYETLHAYIRNAVTPFFNSYAAKFADDDDKDAKTGIPVIKKKMAELELSLLNLHQNVEIPEVHLIINPAIQQAIDRCNAQRKKISVEEVDATLLADSGFMNKLQGGVNGWIKEVHKVTKLERDASTGSAIQEINFWIHMERALQRVEEHLQSDGVVLTREVLKYGKRFHATVSFDSDVGLKECKDLVSKYNVIMKDFPINELLSAADIERIRDSLVLIFSHFLKKLKTASYPIGRALLLVDAIGRDVYDQLVRVLSVQRLMTLPYTDFVRVIALAKDIFRVWEDQLKEFVALAREKLKKEKYVQLKFNNEQLKKLLERIEYIALFRQQHEQLTNTIYRVLRTPSASTSAEAASAADQTPLAVLEGGMDPVEEVNQAYLPMEKLDILDVSADGIATWEAQEQAYNERVSRVENAIIALLRDRLATAKSASEMFRVFSRFNALFVRPKIRGAIQEYQTSLIKRVEEDILTLHKKFTAKYLPSSAARMSTIRDIPELSGTIMWARQMERQLATYVARVEDVLGKGWENYSAGKKLQQEAESFRKKLDTHPIFEEWVADITKRNLKVSGPILDVRDVRTPFGVRTQLVVNFDTQLITLFKEVRNLTWMGFNVNKIQSIAKEGKQVYPFAVSLMETIRTYDRANTRIQEHHELQMLVSGQINEIHTMITRGKAMRWEAFSRPENNRSNESAQAKFVRDLANVVTNYHEKVNDLILVNESITKSIEALETCAFKPKAFTEILDSLQKQIDRFNLESISNLEEWVAKLNERVQTALTARLQLAVKVWIHSFAVDRKVGTSGRTTELPENVNLGNVDDEVREIALATLPDMPTINFELRIRNQVMHLEPPVEQARSTWIQQLFVWLGIVLALPRIQSTRYSIGLRKDELPTETTYHSILLATLKSGDLPKAYAVIDDKVKAISAYVQEWLQYQALWDLEANHVYVRLGDDLTLWQQLLGEIRAARNTFDNADTSRSFGSAVVNYAQVQAKVNAKYDSWQKEILSRFGQRLGGAMAEFFGVISKGRNELEAHSLDGEKTTDAVVFITFVGELKRKLPAWTQALEIYRAGQKLLERQRFLFPADWLHFDQVNGEWTALNEILTRKNAAIQNQIANLQTKIIAEDAAVDKRVKDLTAEWDQNKPVQGDLKPDVATNSLSVFEGRISRLQDEYLQVCKAKEALNLELSQDDRLAPLLEELRDLKGVWTELGRVWQSVAELADTAWSSVLPRKVRGRLDQMLTEIKDLPARLRQYAAYEHVQTTLKAYLKINTLMSDLKSDALRERHWKMLFKRLRVEGKFLLQEMTLGHVWDLNLSKNEQAIKDVILVAQGEMALEEFLKQVRETWQTYELELVPYQNKCRLIRGWDELFGKCGEHVNSLSAMKLSPYFKVFEDEALAWEDKLTRIQVLFDMWIDVQRQWVYLEGIFSGSADIKNLLPTETSRFQSINSEFLALMKKVQKAPNILEVLSIQGVQRSLERLADLLAKIQKALGEYLERERSAFPRFYFVGDEDLLEIIGNSKDIVKIQKHFKKMFAGLANLLLNEDASVIEGMASREGEEVRFRNPISLKNGPKINEWLTALENEMRVTLALVLTDSIQEVTTLFAPSSATIDAKQYLDWVTKYPAQLVVLTSQVLWSEATEKALQQSDKAAEGLGVVLTRLQAILTILADTVLNELPPIMRKKCEHLITELVHQRDVIRALQRANVSSNKSFDWLYHMRFAFNPKVDDPLTRLSIKMANASFDYGYEYLGLTDKLVQTPLTDRCYLTLTQAMELRLGGSPFGPAGTGKTESVKALGAQLGRFVLVFCCDEAFDFQAMGRIFVGVCQTGQWVCFDEFNRLEERILSAVSQQVQTIQTALKEKQGQNKIEIQLVDKTVMVKATTGIFITMNPGYAGRSNLPDNLKKLFRSMAMTKPDRELIAQVMLYSQGFRTAEVLASKVVPFFNLCEEQLSPQPHYDFGLRALKSVLVSAGNLKRDRLARLLASGGGNLPDIAEQEIIIQSVAETVVPKLVQEDIPLLKSLLADVFPGVPYVPADLERLRAEILKVCAHRHLVADPAWVEKVMQLYQIQNINHGLMMVGPSGSGKSKAWQVLLAALARIEGAEGSAHVIDPKAMSKDALYGTLDPTTREWTDGLFTHILRKVIDNVRGELNRRQWIIFDGDVDPEWVENLNSVLDDNKLLTLPNGERLALPPNVRIMFEVQDLRSATLATVSRCGMIWFSDAIVTFAMEAHHYLDTLRNVPLDDSLGAAEESSSAATPSTPSGEHEAEVSPTLRVQRDCASIFAPHFSPDGLIEKALIFAEGLEHIMDFTQPRALNTLFSMLNRSVRLVLEYNEQHTDFPMSQDLLEKFLSKRLLYSLVWSFSGDCKLPLRADLGKFVLSIMNIDLPHSGGERTLIDFEVQVSSGEFAPWSSRVPVVEIDTHKVSAADVVIPTIDTARHEDVLYTWLAEHRPLLLCGPPGSGKTMTLFAALRALPELEVAGLNFSSATTPELILKTFEQYCEYKKTPSGLVLAPTMLNKWLVLFCDEINLPAADKYGTQRVISFLRQMVEQGGFWRVHDKQWVRLSRVQFVGACNPPTDPGRVPLSHRFMRHAPLIMVDYPGPDSLKQIYGTFNRALLKLQPALRSFAPALTDAMVSVYLKSQQHFTPDQQAHYIYSPRELTRWVRGVYEAIKPLESLDLNGLVRLWAHEGLRLFADRLVTPEERQWTGTLLDSIAQESFPAVDVAVALKRPILFSDWLSKYYVPVEQEQLRDYIRARLRVFYEEELDVPLVLFNDLLEHVLRIDRVFKQVQGHLLLIGVSGAGKTTLSRFVAWLNGLSVYQIKVHNGYTMDDFDDDLRDLLRRAGTRGEKIAFILDESNILDAGFLERMNTLLANGEVPGLFDGDEHSALMTQCKEGAQRDGLMLDSPDELYKWFTAQVMRNLHVVFTMNPPEGGLGGRAATSPALFNRCVLDWFGDWSLQAYFQVGKEFTDKLDLDVATYKVPDYFPAAYPDLTVPPSHRDAIVNAFVYIHKSLEDVNARVAKRQGRASHITPRHYLDFIQHYVRLFQNKREQLEEQQLHLNVGLKKLRDTFEDVEKLQKSLAIKNVELEKKNTEANNKLRSMVQEQQEAESRKKASETLQEAVAKQTAAINERKKVVEIDLAKAEPAVREAEQSVKNIKSQHLVEVRGLANPPALVKLALESVCVLLGEKVDSWKTIQGILRRNDFIQSIVNYDTDANMTEGMRREINKNFLSNPDYTFEKVDRASKACGPLVQWVIAQVSFSEILHRVEPLRNEVLSLEKEAAETRLKAEELVSMINELESSIARYKDEYAVLIAETQQLKSEMETVKTKVERATKLLGSLSSERDRWSTTSATFEAQMGTIVGDVLISAAFLAYAGYYDQQYRQMLLHRWTAHLQAANVQLKGDLSITEYLSTADERLAWQSNALPVDDLATENAILLKRFNRYPLIIDPSGQATAFLMNEFKERKITRTSFLDKAFLKTLESALRFGNPLLVEDVEALDPILNPLLNRELRKTGGRVLVRLGAQDIDFSPAFTLFLTTRDSTASFPPDLCSRVTFVNFTVTRASLQSQCLNQVLKAERPDTDQQRTDLLRAQGEFQLRLRQLEKSLLDALNASQGNLLENDAVIATLETLKREAADIAERMAATESVAAAVNTVTLQYTPLAAACSAVYFVMEALNQLHPFYQYSLDFFYSIFEYVLHKNPALQGVKDAAQRLHILNSDLFAVAFKRISRGLLHEDHITLALLLAQIYTAENHADKPSDAEWDYWLSAAAAAAAAGSSASSAILPSGHPLAAVLDEETKERLAGAVRLPLFANSLVPHLTANADEWKAFLSSAAPELAVPQCFESADHGKDTVVNTFRRALVVKLFRPDRVVPAASLLAEAVFGKGVMAVVPSDVAQLKAVVLGGEIQSNTPLALCSVPGLDASSTVDALAREHNHQRMISVAIGSAEGFALADQAISEASKSGVWVLLKNVHLAPSWLVQLEKKLHALKAHPNFRLFMTMEINPAVPASVLRLSRMFVYERAPGLKANLLESISSIPKEDAERAPVERSRLLFLVSWLHGVLQERLRYAPLGWTKVYEFNDADRRCAIDVINAWVDQAAGGNQSRSNIAPEKIPWDAIKTLLSQSIYGGRIDNEFDQRTLDSFVSTLFTPKAFDGNFALVPAQPSAEEDGSASEAVTIPEGTTLAHFAKWIQTLPDRQSPAWLGLPANAEKVLLTSQGSALLSKLGTMKSLSADEEDTVAAPTPASSKKGKGAAAAAVSAPIASDGASTQPAWMVALAATAAEYLNSLPDKMSTLPTTVETMRNPITRVFARETSSGASLLKKIRRDLKDLQSCCQGTLKQTNHLRALMNDVNKGIIPKHWRTYKVPNGVPLSQWVVDFAQRIKQLESIASASNQAPPASLWLGGLLAPEAYITATRQSVAQANMWSLEELSLSIDIAKNDQPEKDTFLLTGLRLEGASWTTAESPIEPSEAMTTRLPTIRLRWTRSKTPTGDGVILPVYLNAARAQLLFNVTLPVKGLDGKGAYQRGLAIVSSPLKGV